MARKSKVESSPHFEEIVQLLLAGKSGRQISTYLKEEYDEDIGFNAINVYRRNHINMEQRVEEVLNKRAEKKRKKEKKKKASAEDAKQETIEKAINETANEKANVKEAINDNIDSVAETIANNMEGVARVSAELPDIFERAKRDAHNTDCKTEWKDVAKISLQANRIYSDYFKHEEDNIEININEGFGELADAISKSREALKD